MGTGDGLFVYHSARTNSNRFYIGVDPNIRPLNKISERIYRNPSKGGAPNVLYVQATVEQLPGEFFGIASELTIYFPWGALLSALINGKQSALRGLRQLCCPGALLEIVMGFDLSRDFAELKRLGISDVSLPFFENTIIPRYKNAGFQISICNQYPSYEAPLPKTSWAKRLRSNFQRLIIHLRATAS